jgi:hypothetical protein
MEVKQRAKYTLALAEAGANKHTPNSTNRRNRHSSRIRLHLFILICVLLAAAGTETTVLVYHKLTADYRLYTSMAQTGAQHLQQAVSLLETLPRFPLNVNAVDQAQQQFSLSLMVFEQIQSGLAFYPGIADVVPVYGEQLNTAARLVTIAIDVSQAGVSGCAILRTLISVYRPPAGIQGQGISGASWYAIHAHLQQIEMLLTQVVNAADQLQPSDVQFVQHSGSIVVAFRTILPSIQMWLTKVNRLMNVVPMLLGINAPSNYLIELLDSTELRPTGGFIGNIGFATLSQGKIGTIHISDVDLLDKPFEFSGHHIPYPAAYRWFSRYLTQGTWLLRDSNLDADFPTAARSAELNYQREGGKVPIQGVIAITPALIAQFLEITGPIYLPEYKETVTAQNLIDRIHYHQLGAGIRGSDSVAAPGGHSSLRKQFTEWLAEYFFARVRQLPASMLPRCLQVLIRAFYTKDIQVYFNEGPAENVLQLLHLDNIIQSPPGDSLFIVDTNVGGDKANRYILSTLDDQVSIDRQGNATHHMTIVYAWVIPGPIYGRSPYQDYVRIYVPPGAVLQSQRGWIPQGASISFGRRVWAGYFSLAFGRSRTIELTWRVPGAASLPVVGLDYSYLIQHQAGTQWTIHLHVELPSRCWIFDVSGTLVKGKQGELALNQYVDHDLMPAVDYVC